ncbi:hypothetical protein CEE37_09880 [candidate division LCP-89 bacterium B3_LCP]|uniref:Transposase IS200-like domain-containing protein n=1 Tax=candidate division LCP-89 bacterium B3_LCP TaxID=2012998 RepID=A0A532UYN3_UNCL8|nr:MAG: hypothetical protein CEE37_09880 [candidate division LCP-89 bacterium B3_LCP]
MGLKYRNSIFGPNLFFVTTSTLGRVNYFNNEERLIIVQQELYKTVRLKSCILMAYVIMPNHIHLLLGSKVGGHGISKFIHSFKGIVRKKIVGDQRFWERGFDDLVITSEEQFRIKLNYIHYNPVKANLVEKPEDWIYSSYGFWELNEANENLTRDFAWLE